MNKASLITIGIVAVIWMVCSAQIQTGCTEAKERKRAITTKVALEIQGAVPYYDEVGYHKLVADVEYLEWLLKHNKVEEYEREIRKLERRMESK